MIRGGALGEWDVCLLCFFRSPGGLEATKGPHSGARVSAAHHAAGAAARCAARQDRHRPKTRAPASDEHAHAHATMRTATRTTDDRRWQAPPECAHANASDTTTPPQQPAGAARYTMARSTCEFLQRTLLGQHGAVSDDVTLHGRGVIFLKPIFHSR